MSKSDIVFISIVIVTLFLIHPVLVIVSGTSTPMAVVRGSSMLPLLRRGDVVFLVHKKPGEIHVGNIIVYRSLRDHLIIHRVIAIIKYNGGYEYVTKGDNNPRDDSFLFEYPPGRGVSYDRVIGVVLSVDGKAFKIPYLGALALMLG